MGKALIIYFSLTGRTEYIAQQLARLLSSYDVQIAQIKYSGTQKSYMKDLSSEIKVDETKLQIPTDILDVSPYDLICIGMPIHGGSPAAVFDRYMQKSSGWQGKQVIPFATGRFIVYQTLALMRTTVEQKGGEVVAEFVVKRFFSIKHVAIEPMIAEFLHHKSTII